MDPDSELMAKLNLPKIETSPDYNLSSLKVMMSDNQYFNTQKVKLDSRIDFLIKKFEKDNKMSYRDKLLSQIEHNSEIRKIKKTLDKTSLLRVQERREKELSRLNYQLL